MGDQAQELSPEVTGHDEAKEAKSSGDLKLIHELSLSSAKRYKWWILVAIYTLFVIGGQSVGTLLGRLYYDNGGKSNWTATFVQCVGFPIFIPFLLMSRKEKHDRQVGTNPSLLTLMLFYVVSGIFIAAECMFYSIGLRYLPVTTYTLICASQLGFNAVFSIFLNKQKLTPYIINSVVVLTISSTLLVFQNDDSGDSKKPSRRKYIIGFIFTLVASSGYALMMSITQLVFEKIIKNDTVHTIVKVSVYQNFVASIVALIGLFASGEWAGLDAEMREFKFGKVSYVMILFWTAVSWQVFTIGSIGLIFRVSSLFSNVISILGLPVAPILAVIFLGDKFTGIKAIAMILAIWGFCSYAYQQYLNDLKAKVIKNRSPDTASDEISLTERV